MASQVNPPPFLRIPKAFLQDREVRAFIEQQNTVIFQLYQKLGGASDPISDLENSSTGAFTSQTQWLQKQIDGMPDFTTDTTGFTTDTTRITTDKVTA
jgi:hypothetical protein